MNYYGNIYDPNQGLYNQINNCPPPQQCYPPSHYYPGPPQQQSYPTYQSGIGHNQGYPQTQVPPRQLPQGGTSQSNGNVPIQELHNVQGYEGATFSDAVAAPPANEEPERQPPSDRQQILNVPNLTEEQAREAVLDFAAETCCYGTKAAREMIINDITYRSAFHYSLETFTEKRETARAFKPYKGTPISVGGYPPAPWEIKVSPTTPFEDEKVVIEIPNTDQVGTCHVCAGMGDQRCENCSGEGKFKCKWCHGSGQQFRTDPCSTCHGSGYDRECSHCDGKKRVTCKACNGIKQLRFFMQLTVTWTNHVANFVSDTKGFPKDLIKEVSGQVALNERNSRVFPVTQFPDQSVFKASKRIVASHKEGFPFEKTLEQRQKIQIVPIAEVIYKWKSKEGKFHVYGFESAVHFPNYPQSCCWGCNVL